MRAYTVATAALAINVDQKWLDNLLSHHHVPGVARAQRGVRRRIPPPSIQIIALARLLNDELSIPLHRALDFAARVVTANAPEFRVSDSLTLLVDLQRLAADLAKRLEDAAEFAPVPRRGRPAAHRTRPSLP